VDVGLPWHCNFRCCARHQSSSPTPSTTSSTPSWRGRDKQLPEIARHGTATRCKSHLMRDHTERYCLKKPWGVAPVMGNDVPKRQTARGSGADRSNSAAGRHRRRSRERGASTINVLVGIVVVAIVAAVLVVVAVRNNDDNTTKTENNTTATGPATGARHRGPPPDRPCAAARWSARRRARQVP
jgi:hypothetical protein